MKAWEIIHTIKCIKDEDAVKMLEDIFMYGYVKGINRGYDNALRVARKNILSGDLEEGKKIFAKKYL